MPNSITRFGLVTESVDHAEELLSSVYAPVKVSGDGSRLHLSVTGVRCGQLSLYRTQSTTGVTFTSEPVFDGYTFSVFSTGGQAVSLYSRSKPKVLEGPVIACDATQVKQVICAPDLKFKGLSFESSLLHRCLTELTGSPVSSRIRFTSSIDPAASSVSTLVSLWQALLSGLDGDGALSKNPAAVNHLRLAMANILLTAIPNNYSERIANVRRPSAAPGHVVRAIDFMKSNVARPLTLDEIAGAAETSTRALQEGFRRFRDSTPLAFLRSLRLEGVRRDLLDPHAVSSVCHVAVGWGFGHMGVFSRYYKQAFGESPGQTLARRPAGR